MFRKNYKSRLQEKADAMDSSEKERPRMRKKRKRQLDSQRQRQGQGQEVHEEEEESDPRTKIMYSDKYYDDHYEYRHVFLPKEIYLIIMNVERLLSERECYNIGIQMTEGWIHYGYHLPKPNVLLFKRPFTGSVNPRRELVRQFEAVKAKVNKRDNNKY